MNQPQPNALLTASSYILLILLWALSLFVYFQVPDVIPVHFNASGVADGHGTRLFLFIFPTLSTALFFFFGYLASQPQMLNYPVRKTPENQQALEALGQECLLALRSALSLGFMLLLTGIYLAAKNQTNQLGTGYFWAFLGLILGTTGAYIVKMIRIR